RAGQIGTSIGLGKGAPRDHLVVGALERLCRGRAESSASVRRGVSWRFSRYRLSFALDRATSANSSLLFFYIHISLGDGLRRRQVLTGSLQVAKAKVGHGVEPEAPAGADFSAVAAHACRGGDAGFVKAGWRCRAGAAPRRHRWGAP